MEALLVPWWICNQCCQFAFCFLPPCCTHLGFIFSILTVAVFDHLIALSSTIWYLSPLSFEFLNHKNSFFDILGRNRDANIRSVQPVYWASAANKIEFRIYPQSDKRDFYTLCPRSVGLWVSSVTIWSCNVSHKPSCCGGKPHIGTCVNHLSDVILTTAPELRRTHLCHMSLSSRLFPWL